MRGVCGWTRARAWPAAPVAGDWRRSSSRPLCGSVPRRRCDDLPVDRRPVRHVSWAVATAAIVAAVCLAPAALMARAQAIHLSVRGPLPRPKASTRACPVALAARAAVRGGRGAALVAVISWWPRRASSSRPACARSGERRLFWRRRDGGMLGWMRSSFRRCTCGSSLGTSLAWPCGRPGRRVRDRDARVGGAGRRV